MLAGMLAGNSFSGDWVRLGCSLGLLIFALFGYCFSIPKKLFFSYFYNPKIMPKPQ